MSKKNIKLYIDDIKMAIEKIEEYTKGMSRENFEKENMTIDAVIRNLEIIGEAVNNIPENIQEKYPDIPWREIIGMRNELPNRSRAAGYPHSLNSLNCLDWLCSLGVPCS